MHQSAALSPIAEAPKSNVWQTAFRPGLAFFAINCPGSTVCLELGFDASFFQWRSRRPFLLQLFISNAAEKVGSKRVVRTQPSFTKAETAALLHVHSDEALARPKPSRFHPTTLVL